MIIYLFLWSKLFVFKFLGDVYVYKYLLILIVELYVIRCMMMFCLFIIFFSGFIFLLMFVYKVVFLGKYLDICDLCIFIYFIWVILFFWFLFGIIYWIVISYFNCNLEKVLLDYECVWFVFFDFLLFECVNFIVFRIVLYFYLMGYR